MMYVVEPCSERVPMPSGFGPIGMMCGHARNAHLGHHAESQQTSETPRLRLPLSRADDYGNYNTQACGYDGGDVSNVFGTDC